MGLRRLIYISTSAALGPADVRSIIASSEKNNPARGVTGLLLYNGRNFLQMIEGEEASLLGLMALVTRDRRHSGIVTMLNEPIESPCCPDWRMKLVDLERDIEKRRVTISNALPETLLGAGKDLIVNFALLN